MRTFLHAALALTLSTFRLAAGEQLESWQAILKSDHVARLQLRCHGPSSETLAKLAKLGEKGFRLVSFTATEEIDELDLSVYSYRCVTELSQGGRTWARGSIEDSLDAAIEAALKKMDEGLRDDMFDEIKNREEITVKIDVIHEKDHRKLEPAEKK